MKSFFGGGDDTQIDDTQINDTQINDTQINDTCRMSLNNEQNKFKSQVTVPISGKHIAKMLDNYNDTSLGDNIDDKIEAISARLKGINASYELENTNKNYKSTSVARKAQELFNKDTVTIDVLGNTYEVNIDDNALPLYYGLA